IVAVEPDIRPNWQGYLCQLTLSDYVERLRDRLPTKIKGRDFLDRFEDPGDAMTTVDPDKVYKVRSRTEHHIYENTRAHQFAERLCRAARSHDQIAITEAGELMYASHWSYGQRCGLGGIETDRLVNLLRAEGPATGILGAKVSARGAGGTVVVLHTDTDGAREAIRRATDQYARLTDLDPRIFAGTSPGAGAWGVHEIG
ncbi:MAG: GHMP kinase, partial [Planctomycetes bacterium]|nr:GHMP kinase [Planctomycetota bacterium]